MPNTESLPTFLGLMLLLCPAVVAQDEQPPKLDRGITGDTEHEVFVRTSCS